MRAPRQACGPRPRRWLAWTACAAALLLVASPAAAQVWVPGSGDVTRDGRKTALDGLKILESQSWPAAERAALRGWLDACDVNRNGQCDAADAYDILLSVITDWNDYDGDGVVNAADCAPLDERLAVAHTYYVDRDLDNLGSGAEPVQACTTAPDPPLVPWDGDANDFSVAEAFTPVPRGDRRLGLDFADAAESGAWRTDLARELGIDATPVRLEWSQLESAPGVYQGPQVQALSIVASAYAAQGLKVALAINPVSSGYLTLPADLQADVEAGRRRLNDPAVVARFLQLLTFVRGALPNTELVSLQIGYEVDRFFAQASVPPGFWADYGGLVLAAAAHAKSVWSAQLPIAVTATYDGLTGQRTAAPLAAINGLVDIVSATYSVAGAGYTGVEPARIRTDLQRIIALAYPKQVHLQAVEYASAPAAGGSETRQSQFVRAVFDIWDQYAALMPYVSFGRLHDRSPARAAAEAGSGIGAPPVSAAGLASTGLRTWKGGGEAKAAYKTLRNLAFARGWWRTEAPAHRSFEMGFTQAPYDAPGDPATETAMLQSIHDLAAANGSFYNLHLDNGVPWVEAAADDFSSPTAPYSAYLRSSWTAQKAHIPAGQRLMVSVNPTGVPRDVIAPYFGVGQGFIYNDRFERIGDGIVGDFENRLPPAPWDTYAFDHPQVQRAFSTYCRRVVQQFQPEYLIVAIETTATLHEDPDAYRRLLTLIRAVRSQLSAWPDTRSVKVLVSISATSFMVDEYGLALKREELGPLKLETQVQGLIDLAPDVDGLALSFYPHYSKWNSTFMLPSMYDELWRLLGDIGKPIGIAETGWPAETFTVLGTLFVSDEEQQARYFRLLFAEAEKAPVPVDFLVNFRTRDGDLQWQGLLDWSLQEPPLVSPQFVEFYKYFRDIGLFDGNGGERPATTVWREHLARPYVPRTPH